jgi:hypothetical protein
VTPVKGCSDKRCGDHNSGWAVTLRTNRLLEVEVRVDGTWHPGWLDTDY